MTDPQYTYHDLLDDLRALITDIDLEPMPGPGLDVDVAGRMRKYGNQLIGMARNLESEMAPGTEGDSYRYVETRKADRSYNTARLIDAFGEAGVSFQSLIEQGAVRLGWQWTKLRDAASRAGVTIGVTPNEIPDDGDLDGPMIGEVWKSTYRVVVKEAE